MIGQFIWDHHKNLWVHNSLDAQTRERLRCLVATLPNRFNVDPQIPMRSFYLNYQEETSACQLHNREIRYVRNDLTF